MEVQRTQIVLARHELECLKLAKEGHSNEAIARTKFYAKASVEQIFHHIYCKMGLTHLPPSGKRQAAILHAERNGWI